MAWECESFSHKTICLILLQTLLLLDIKYDCSFHLYLSNRSIFQWKHGNLTQGVNYTMWTVAQWIRLYLMSSKKHKYDCSFHLYLSNRSIFQWKHGNLTQSVNYTVTVSQVFLELNKNHVSPRSVNLRCHVSQGLYVHWVYLCCRNLIWILIG